MSKFKPGDIVYYMDGSTLCQAVVCVEDGNWPVVPEGFCLVYNISPDHGSRVFKHDHDSSQYCDMVETDKLYHSAEKLILSIKAELKQEYDKKIRVLDDYSQGSPEQKQSLSRKVKDILLGRNI